MCIRDSPPSEHVARLFETDDDFRTFSHFIDGGSRGRFLMVTDGPDVRVFDIEGNEQTVNYGITYVPVFSRALAVDDLASTPFKVIVPNDETSIQLVTRWETTGASATNDLEFVWERSPNEDFSSDVTTVRTDDASAATDADRVQVYQYTGSVTWDTANNGQWLRCRVERAGTDTFTVEAGIALYSTAYVAQEADEDPAVTAVTYEDDTYICNSSVTTKRVPWRYNQAPYFAADDYTLRVWPGQDTPMPAGFLLTLEAGFPVSGVAAAVPKVYFTNDSDYGDTWSGNNIRTPDFRESNTAITNTNVLRTTIQGNSVLNNALSVDRRNNTLYIRRKDNASDGELDQPFSISFTNIEPAFYQVLPRVNPDYTRGGDVLSESGELVSWGGLGPVEFEAFPSIAPDGFISPVSGAAALETDNYYVRFRATLGHPLVNAMSEGYWEEVATPIQSNAFEAYSMPHVLRQEEDGTFTYRPVNWSLREAGDDDSNPFPSFLGRTISRMFVHEGRLGLLSGSTVFFSEVGVFHNLFRTTAAELLDSDPIDVSASIGGGGAAELDFTDAVSFDQRLILFSENSQHSLTGGEILSPSSVSISRITDFRADVVPSPTVSGRNLYFLAESGRNTSVVEYFRGNTGSGEGFYDGDVLTRFVPSLIPQGESRLVAAPGSDLIVVSTTGAPDSLFLNSIIWTGRERQQAAWSKWSFDGATLVNLSVFGGALYLLMARDNDGDPTLFVERVSLDPNSADPDADFKVYLDRRIHSSQVTLFEGVGLTQTAMRIPWEPEAGVTYVLVSGRNTSHTHGGGPYEVGEVVLESRGIVAPVDTGTNLVVFDGGYWDDSQADYYIGIRYDMEVEMTRPSLRVSPERGQPAVPVIDERVTVDSYGVSYTDTGYLQLETTSGYAVTPSVYTVGTLGRPSDSSNPFPKLEGFLGGIIAANPVDTKIVLRNSSHLPCTVYQAAWAVSYTHLTLPTTPYV